MRAIWQSRRRLLQAASLIGLAGTAESEASVTRPKPAARHLDLETAWDNLTAYLKTRSDISGKPSLSWTSGHIYSHIAGQPARRLLLGQGVKCTRCVRIATGYEFLERECVIFSDPDTAEPLQTWRNPFTGHVVEVFHIRNLSAGNQLSAAGPDKSFHMPYMEHSGDVTFYDDLFYSKPSSLNVFGYSAYVGSNLYEGAGIYHFHARRADLDNPDLSAVPATTSHTGLRQWLPWMEMGAWSGALVLPSRGKKLPNGVADLPQPLRGWLEKNSPEFLEAPTLADQANNQKRFYDQFRDHIDRKRAAGRDPPK
jgi:hypothetical protein